MRQLKELSGTSDSSVARPISFYEWNLDKVLVIINFIGIISRILSIITICLLSNILDILIKQIQNNLCENILPVKSESIEDSQTTKHTKDKAINHINHSCESIEKESESIEKEKVQSLPCSLKVYNSPISMVDYYKKIIK
jgi:hypothetical protein